jgi:7-cyano-7-deazaguanine synthase in queuosine biosynthesis
LATLKAIAESRPIRITPVFFNYGQRSAIEEAKAVKDLIPAIQEFANNVDQETSIDDCISIPLGNCFSWSESAILQGRPKEGNVGVENRNMVLISYLASIVMAGKSDENRDYTEIITGFTNDYYDTNLAFVQALNRLFETMGKRIRVVTPLIPDRQKEPVSEDSLLRIARSLGVIPLLREKTWSCYFPQDGQICKDCPPCKKRRRIFTELAIKTAKHK